MFLQKDALGIYRRFRFHRTRSGFLKHIKTIPTIRANLTMLYVFDQISGQSFGFL